MTAFEDLATISFLNYNDAKFRVAQAGIGPDIVWVPGGDSPPHYWAEQFAWFHKDFRCTSYDRAVSAKQPAASRLGPWSSSPSIALR